MNKIRKIEEDLHREISFIINSKIKDPRVGFVTVTGTKLSPDCHYLDIFVSIMDLSKKEDSFNSLKKCDGFIKKNLKERFKLRNMPELRFIYDQSIDKGLKVSTLLENLKETGKK